MIEYWERRHAESWIDRWRRLTGNLPDRSIFKSSNHINGASLQYNSFHTIGDDALTAESRKFRNEKVRESA